MSWDVCVTILRTSLGKPSPRRLPGSHVPQTPEQLGEGIGRSIETPGDEGSLGATVSISQSSGVSAWTVGPGPCLHAHPAEGCPPFFTHVPARVVQGTSPASSLGRGWGDIWVCIQAMGRHMPLSPCTPRRQGPTSGPHHLETGTS